MPSPTTSLSSTAIPAHKSHFSNPANPPTNPFFKKQALLYNPFSQSLRVESEASILHQLASKNNRYQSLPLPNKHSSQVAIFIDPDSKITLGNRTSDTKSNDLLVVLHLDRLGLWDRVLRAAGLLERVYVLDEEGDGEEEDAENNDEE